MTNTSPRLLILRALKVPDEYRFAAPGDRNLRQILKRSESTPACVPCICILMVLRPTRSSSGST